MSGRVRRVDHHCRVPVLRTIRCRTALDEGVHRVAAAQYEHTLDEGRRGRRGDGGEFLDETVARQELRYQYVAARVEGGSGSAERDPTRGQSGLDRLGRPEIELAADRVDVDDFDCVDLLGPAPRKRRLARGGRTVDQHQRRGAVSRFVHPSIMPPVGHRRCADTVTLVQRVAIVGSSGAGKSTVAATISVRLRLDVIELDALMHGPNWTPTPTPAFRAKLIEAIDETEGRGWVIPGNYRTVADIVQGGADTIVWIDLPRRTVTWRLAKRSLRRALTREAVWGGNRERLRDLVSRDPARNVVLWSWQHHDAYRELYESYSDADFWAHANVHRLRSPTEVDAFLASIGSG